MTQHRQIEIHYRKKIEKEHEQNFTSNVIQMIHKAYENKNQI